MLTGGPKRLTPNQDSERRPLRTTTPQFVTRSAHKGGRGVRDRKILGAFTRCIPIRTRTRQFTAQAAQCHQTSWAPFHNVPLFLFRISATAWVACGKMLFHLAAYYINLGFIEQTTIELLSSRFVVTVMSRKPRPHIEPVIEVI